MGSEAVLLVIRSNWDLHLELRERGDRCAESEREAAAVAVGLGRNRVEFWDKPLIPGSARRRWSSLVLQGNDIQRFVHVDNKV